MPRWKPKKINGLPASYSPQVLDRMDKRCWAYELVRQRFETLIEETGADSFAKQQICLRCAYLSTKLESMEIESLEGKKDVPMTVYVQAANTLKALLVTLGLDKRRADALDLKSYIAKKDSRANDDT